MEPEDAYMVDQSVYQIYQNLCERINSLEESMMDAIVNYAHWLTEQDPEGLLIQTKEAENFLDMRDVLYHSYEISHDVVSGTFAVESITTDDPEFFIVPDQWFENREQHEEDIKNSIKFERERNEAQRESAEVIELETYRRLKEKFEGVSK